MALVGLSIGAGAQDRTMTSPTSTPASARSAAGATLLVLGDSLSAEYGLPRGSGWVTLLGQRLDQTHPGWQVVNASISGETTSGGRARLPALLGKHHPRLVIIELGGNDALRGLSLQQTREHLQAMVQASLGAGAKVLLLGMQMPPTMARIMPLDLPRCTVRWRSNSRWGWYRFSSAPLPTNPTSRNGSRPTASTPR